MDIYNAGVKTVRLLIGCACCLLCAGPIFIIAGIVILIAPNHFTQHVSEYKSAIALYASSGAESSMQQLTAPNFMLLTVPVPITGVNADNIPKASSVVLASAVPLNTGSSRSITVSQTYSINVPSSAPYDGFRSATLPSSICTGSSCTNSDCKKQFGDAAHLSGTPGRCMWYQYWEYACIPVQWTSDGLINDATLASCDYITLPMGSYTQTGFGWQPLTLNTSSDPSQLNKHTVKLMSSNDPYIAAMRITQGTMDFGLTQTQQRLIGIALISVGVSFVACMVGVVVCVRRRTKHDPRNTRALYTAFGREYEPIDQSSSLYGQPQQSYPYPTYGQQQSYPYPGTVQQQPYAQPQYEKHV